MLEAEFSGWICWHNRYDPEYLGYDEVVEILEEILEVVTAARVKEILETKANDVLVIEPTKESIDKNERLVPYIKDEIVKQINIAENTILIDWPEDF